MSDEKLAAIIKSQAQKAKPEKAIKAPLNVFCALYFFDPNDDVGTESKRIIAKYKNGIIGIPQAATIGTKRCLHLHFRNKDNFENARKLAKAEGYLLPECTGQTCNTFLRTADYEAVIYGLQYQQQEFNAIRNQLSRELSQIAVDVDRISPDFHSSGVIVKIYGLQSLQAFNQAYSIKPFRLLRQDVAVKFTPKINASSIPVQFVFC